MVGTEQKQKILKNRWQEYTEEVYKKDLHDPDNHDGVITHLEPDILECAVKWALGSITMNKATGGDGSFRCTTATQPYVHMYLFSPKLPCNPGWHITLSRVPCDI